MASEGTACKSDALPSETEKETKKSSKKNKEHCATCRVHVSVHFGKPGVGQCFGSVVTKAFADLFLAVKACKSETELLRSETAQLRSETRDIEARVLRKVSDLSQSVSDVHATYEEKLSHVVKSLAQVEEKMERMSSGVGVHGKKQNKCSKKKNGNDSNESPNQQTCLASTANSDAVLNWASTCPSEIEELSSEAEEEGHSTRGRSKTRQRSRTKRHNAMANGESSSRPGYDTRPNTGTKPHQ